MLKYSNRAPKQNVFLTLIFLTFVTASFHSANAAVLFEGYYKIMLGADQIGFVAQKYESFPEKKQLKATYYTYANAGGESTTEGLTALCDENFEPISYQYTGLAKGQTKTIDATFANKKMTAKVVSAGKQKTLTADVKPNGFLSVFLNYVILKNGMMAGKSYSFVALAEEEGVFYDGQAAIKSEQQIGPNKAFKIDFNFKNVEFTGLVTTKGDTLGSLQQNLRTELVASREEATQNYKANEKGLIAIFGELPKGRTNPLAVDSTMPSKQSPAQLNQNPVQLNTNNPSKGP